MTLRLHLNENTAGCSPAVLAAIRAIEPRDLSTYPDYADITRTCERWFGVPSGWVQLTNGLDEGLHVVAQQARPGAALIVEPAFDMYELCAAANRLPVSRTFWSPNSPFPVEDLLASVDARTRLIYLTDPNNPTGLPIPAGMVERTAAAAPHATVLLDEAYAEFSGRTLIGEALERHRNLVVGRTFSKAFGLAALRVGALVAHPDTLAPLRALLPPFSLNVCGIRALTAAMEDRAWLELCVAQSHESRALIHEFAQRLNLKAWPSEANFVLIRIGSQASAVVAALSREGILIRDRSTQPGCSGCVRITAGVVDHTRQCLAALEVALAQSHN